MKRLLALLPGTLLPLLLAGCGGGGGSAAGAVAPHTITGQVTASGSPLSLVAVSIAGGGAGTTVYSDGNGRYTLNNVPDGSYLITPTLAGHSFTPASRTVTVNGNGAAADFAATAIPTYSVSGKVASANGLGLAGVTVTVTFASTGAVTTGTTDGSGSFSVGGLADGRYLVALSDAAGDSFTPAGQTVTIADADAGANFAAPAVASYGISGKVATAAGAGLAGVTLTVGSNSGAGYSTATDAAGNYALSGLADGYYTLTPTLAGYDFQPNPLLVQVNGATAAGSNITAYPAGSGGGGVTINF